MAHLFDFECDFLDIDIKQNIYDTKLVLKILGDALDHPNHPKYKDLNLKRISERLAKSKWLMDVLYESGFVHSKDGKRLILVGPPSKVYEERKKLEILWTKMDAMLTDDSTEQKRRES